MGNAEKVFELKNFDVDKASVEQLRELVKHLQDQMNSRYVYLVGEWAGIHQAKSTRNGEFVKREDVIEYLK